ncbi:hypothetical protein F2Q70_00021338 [Brassica cretica]|uniref:Carboxypeptidase n=1 Tax=Brassica cretica TaxID=69181 RepID=A0A8S9GQY3_BRACR|nr:hypothetical protein F2Q70_00021338 [Brassica cretica]
MLFIIKSSKLSTLWISLSMGVCVIFTERWRQIRSCGDQDSVIPLTGSRTLVKQLAQQLGLSTTVPYRVWFAGQQVYGNVLAFATVRGAAHEVPFSQPERSLVLFKAFLGGNPLPEEF